MTKRIFVLDTNVLMHDPSALFRFQEHDLFLPMVVLEELDNAKKGLSEVSRNVRQVSRFIDQILADRGKAEIIAGDFHIIRRRLPDNLEGKGILTNTVTAQDTEELRKRGVSWLVTTTPELDGRSFGTNVLEAALLAQLGKTWEDVTPEDYLSLIHEAKLLPRVVRFN